MSDNESQESLDYLQARFDPSSLTVPRLRSILVSHDIPYPSGAKKPQLIEIFTEQVLPQSRKILSARSRARRTSKGITNADRSDAGVLLDEEPILPPPTSRPKSARKPSTRIKAEDSESEARTRTRSRSRSPVKQAPRLSSAKHPRPPTEDNSSGPDTIRRTVRKTRKSEAPVVKSEDLDEDYPRKGGAFSDDNPFQSGSSPISTSRSPSGEGRRKSLHETPGNRKSSSMRRRTDVPQAKADEGIVPPSRATFELSDSHLDHSIDFDENGVEASEEFTPEEQLQLDNERAIGLRNAAAVRRPRKKAARGFNAKGPLWVVFLTMLGGYAAWYRQEKLAVGYCGIGRPAAPIISSKLDQLPDWAVALAEPECDTCPQHAFCYERLETSCEPDFVLKPHPLALGGLIPLPPTCEPDGEKVRRIKVVADRAVEELRERRAKFECGELESEGGKPVKNVEIGEEELKNKVSAKRRRGMGQAEFEELWAGAIGEIMGREEVEVVNDETTSSGHSRLSSSSLSKISLTCSIRRSFRLALARHRLQIGILTLVAMLILYARHRYTTYLTINAAIPELISVTLERLTTQATRHTIDPISFPESYIPISQLRDDVLRDEHSLSKRDRIWQKVRNVVEMNANVRSAQRQDRNGDISRVWEWIGAVGQVEDRELRRKSGRVSWGQFGEASSPVSGTDGGPEVVQQKWQEGRPIY